MNSGENSQARRPSHMYITFLTVNGVFFLCGVGVLAVAMPRFQEQQMVDKPGGASASAGLTQMPVLTGTRTPPTYSLRATGKKAAEATPPNLCSVEMPWSHSWGLSAHGPRNSSARQTARKAPSITATWWNTCSCLRPSGCTHGVSASEGGRPYL
jgi:hypothetical protein